MLRTLEPVAITMSVAVIVRSSPVGAPASSTRAALTVPGEVMVARAIVEQSRQVWLVADGSKMGRPAMIEMAPIKAVHTVFTDTAPDAAFERLLRDWDVHCVVASSA